MPMIPRTIRLTPDAAALIERAADDLGLSMSQFIREAALIRAYVIVGHEDSVDLAGDIESLARQGSLQHLARPRV